ncbi:MAG: M48 family metallopeptidase [Flammeovirgaceae bacterium]|nr:M48 family metallopeptidase [Flammeovirgaceae bacterium]MDW8288531.1 M48 family metallopeptidase [Flammeovirgaceae bacterium]
MKLKSLFVVVFAVCFLLPIYSCDDDGDVAPVFSIEHDIKLGQETVEAIKADSVQFPILDPVKYSKSYAYLRGILNKVLASNKIKYRDRFGYQEIKIIRRDDVLNAFCTPGGYIFVYTGLIKYLDSEDHLAGVLGHEIAHAEERHSSSQLQKQLGVQFLLSIVLGKGSESDVVKLLGNLLALKFSRNDEYEADENSVEYLAGSGYQCNGTAGFFQKIESQGGGARVPEFLSTHPNPGNRIQRINEKVAKIGCSTTPSNTIQSYKEFKASLP